MIPPTRFPGRPLNTVLDLFEEISKAHDPDPVLIDAARRELKHLEFVAEQGLRLAQNIVDNVK